MSAFIQKEETMRRSITPILILVFLPGYLLAACSSGVSQELKPPSSLEEIDGSEFKRVRLTERAAERLGIQTAPVQEEVASITRSFSSEVVNMAQDGLPDSHTFWVRVSLTQEMQQMVDRSVPVYVVLEDDDEGEDMIGEPDDGQVDDDAENNFTSIYYKVTNPQKEIFLGQRLLVKIPLVGNGELHKIVPFAAVIYGVHGETWVYTNPEPLVYIREPVVIDFIQDDWAILSEGPEIGTAVVTLGVAELFGAETGVSK
jgi:hypothetical protein